MIGIVSKKDFERTTEDVIDWLNYYGHQPIRVNGDEVLEDFNLCINKLSGCSTIWFRRLMDTQPSFYKKNDELTDDDYLIINRGLGNETSKVFNALFTLLKEKNWLSHPLSEVKINKLQVLLYAEKIGLNIPDTHIVSNKSEISDLLNEHDSLITKCLNETEMFKVGDDTYSLLTRRISKEALTTIPNKFLPSFVQEEIIKEFEVRSFLLDDTFHSMAIFSQNDVQTSVDFRDYNINYPNRRCPIVLPKEVTKKLHRLCTQLQLKTCSIDLIKDRESDAFYFLEINPVGQFGMTSYPCNYSLEKKIAEYLIKQNETQSK